MVRIQTAGALACVVAAAAAILAAQEPKLEKPSSTVIITGCLQHADPAVNLGEPPPGFVLTEAIPPASSPTASKDASAAAQEPAGTAGTRPITYALEGNDAELALHAAHQVEITGSITAPAPADPQPHGANARPQPDVARLHVASIKDVAMDCASKSN